MLEKFLSTLGGRRKSDTEIVCKCPAHPDKTPSLSVSLKDGKILFYCFAGCSQNSVFKALKDLSLIESRPTTITPIGNYLRK
jgi:DNA primase